MTKEKDQELLKEIRDRFRLAYDAANENYNDAIADLNFLNGEQWPSDIKANRDLDGRPCLVINKLPAFIDQIIGDIRQNEPQVKIKPVDSKADRETAEIIGGLIKNIEIQSDAETAYDTAAESCVECGVGAFRVVTEYSEDDSFDQDIKIKRIKNPFTICWDPSSQEWDKQDSNYLFVTEKISKEEFEKLYPGKGTASFSGGKDRDVYWGDDKTIRIVEYFRKTPVKKKLYLLKNINGELYLHEEKPPQDENQWQVVKEREVDSHKIEWCKSNGSEILEELQDWVGKYYPIVMVYGKELNIEGKTVYKGMVRNAKDAQKLYNYARSNSAEVINLAPKAPYLITATMIKNYQAIWDKAHKRNFPYLPYDVDPLSPNTMPHRTEPVGQNTGIQAEVMTADQELHDTAGLQLASLGKKSNEKSGRAILARQREGDVGNFVFYDNLARAIKCAGRIILDLIPKIYDTQRIIRIFNPDGTDKFVPINQPFQGQDAVQRIYDMTVGKYDVVVSVGPSFTTQREEAAENMLMFIQAVPQAGALLGDIFAKNLDWPGASEIEKRLKLMLPPQVQQAEGGQPQQPPQQDPNALIMQRGMAAKVQGQELDNEAKFHDIQLKKMGGQGFIPEQPA